MSEIASLAAHKRRLYASDVREFEQVLLPLFDDPATPDRIRGAATDMLAYAGRRVIAFNKQEYIMLFPAQQRAVARMLRGSRRPAVANELWALCFENMTLQGLVSFDRARYAAELGVTPNEVSRLIAELVEFGALIREGKPRSYTYRLNPHVGTRQGLSKATKDAQAKANVLELRAIPTERRGRSPVLPFISP